MLVPIPPLRVLETWNLCAGCCEGRISRLSRSHCELCLIAKSRPIEIPFNSPPLRLKYRHIDYWFLLSLLQCRRSL